MNTKNMTTLPITNLISPATAGRRGVLLFTLALGCFSLSPFAQAVTPAPDGGYQGNNTAEGDGALNNLPSSGGGLSNTAIGAAALFHNTTGSTNTATGEGALLENTSGDDNTASGVNALASNDAGSNNTANGFQALFFNTGNNNAAFGFSALFSNTSGYNNTAAGFQALYSNTTAFNNVATGSAALQKNTTGNTNTANGAAALAANTSGNSNTADGSFALSHNTSGSSNIALGYNAGGNLTTGSNNIDIGNAGVAGESGKIRIGKSSTATSTFIAGIYNKSEGGTIKPIYINSSGQLGTQPPASSLRFKKAIKPMEKSSEAILGLKPVTFQYKSDSTGTPQFGLIAEEVAKVNPDLVVPEENGEPYTVRYDAVNAMLLNEFLKEHRQVAEQHATLAEQQSTIAKLKAAATKQQATNAQQQQQIEALTAGLQKVRAAVELDKPAATKVADRR